MPFDGLVRRQMHVAGAGLHLDLVRLGHPTEPPVRAVPGEVGRARALGVGVRRLAPCPGADMTGLRSGRHQVHRHHGELQQRTALQEQHLELVGDLQRGAQPIERGAVHGVVLGAAMAHLDQGHPTALVVQQLVLHLGEHLDRQRARSGAEVPDAVHRATPLSAICGPGRWSGRWPGLFTTLSSSPSSKALMTSSTPSTTASWACWVDAPT